MEWILVGLGMLYGLYYFIRRSKVDDIITQIQVTPAKEILKEEHEIARLEQEIKDGKIDYTSARAELNDLRARAAQLRRPE